MSSDTIDPIIGRTLGDFLVKEKLGEGGFGAVYKAIQLTLAREAVIKVLHTRHRTKPEIIDRFKREAHLASRLEHPYTASIYSFGAEADGLLWLAMEYVAGTPLNEVLETQGRLPLERFVPLLDKICEVVYTAHEFGIVHRDLKPANVMVISRAGRLLPKLLDFGIAKGLEDVSPRVKGAENSRPSQTSSSTNAHSSPTNPNALTSVVTGDNQRKQLETVENPIEVEHTTKILPPTSETPAVSEEPAVSETPEDEGKTGVIGSPAYMAPEQWLDPGKVDFRTDIYALAVMAYQILTGEIPFKGQPMALMLAHTSTAVPPLGKGLPSSLDKVIAKAMAKTQAERYQTALEFAQAFREAAGYGDKEITLPQIDELWRDNLLANAPKPLADTINNLLMARNAYQFRDRVLIILRVVVRYIGILALACQVRVAGNQPESELVAKAITNLRQQGLSELQWLELIRELCRPFAKKRDAYPIPELVSLFFAVGSEQLSPLTETFTQLLQLQNELKSSASLTEEQLVSLLDEFLAKLTILLKAAAWLLDYYLVLPEGSHATKWMGAAKDSPIITLKTQNLGAGKAVLVDANGYFVLSLWPLVEIVPPTPGTPLEVFLLAGKGRHGAKLVSFPDGFEHENEAPWQWLKEHFLTAEEKTQIGQTVEKSPYLGLTTFLPTDATLFFGRERETEAFLNRLRVQPLLAVVGPSGAGKSSFIQAGVIPGLPQNWQTITVRPGGSPLAALAAKLTKSGIEVGDLKAKLQKGSQALGTILREFAGKQGITLLLVVDQFEEILTLCLDKAEQKLYVESLVMAARSEEDPVRIVFTMRDDFLVRAKELSGLRDRLTQGLEILTTPASAELLRILTEPARHADYEFEDSELPVEIVDAVTGQTSALPLLAFTAAKLWEQRDKQFKQLRRKSYEAMGGVGGALAKHAEEMMIQMSQAEQLLVREAFRHLVTSEGTRAVLTRPELLQLLDNHNEGEAVLEKLISTRLLVATEGEKGLERIEVVHEALLSAWPRLVKWRQEDAEGARLRDQLRAAARQWEERGKPKGLLWRDEALTEYKLWYERYPGKLTNIEEEFGHLSLTEMTKSQNLRRNLLIGAIIILVMGTGILFYQEYQTKAQLRQTLELYEEQGRQEILKGNFEGAAVYLSEAYGKGDDKFSLRMMLGVALSKPISQTLKSPTTDPDANSDENTDAGLITTASFSPDDQFIVTSSTDKTARLWRAKDGTEQVVLKGHEASVGSASFSPDGRFIVTSSTDKTARIWKVDGTLVATLNGHTDALSAALFSPNGKQIVTASYDQVANIWNAATGKLESRLAGHQGAIYAVCFSKDGKQIATASADKTVKIWDSSTGKLTMTLTGHQAGILSLDFSNDGKLLVTGSLDKTAKIWQLNSGKEIATLAEHKGGVGIVSFNPQGDLILTIGGDDKARLWYAATGQLKTRLLGHQADISSGKFSSNGKLIVTGGYDRTVRVWDSSNGKLLVLLKNNQMGLVGNIAISRNGEQVVSLSDSRESNADLWRLGAEEHRSPDDIVSLVKAKIPFYLEDGRLIAKDTPESSKEVVAKETEEAEESEAIWKDLGLARIDMISIPGGTFAMGSPLEEIGRQSNELLHPVTLSPFYIGKYEITQRQWRKVSSLPAINIKLNPNPSSFKGDNLPVEQVSWDDAVEFCARLSKATGKEYRLPTEAEWEYAARAGSKSSYAGELDEMAWYDKTSEQKTHTVGEKKPNDWGLYDMSGNIWEWCSDWYEAYSNEVTTDPKGASSGSYRVLRGGSWSETAFKCRAAHRYGDSPDSRLNTIGFRVVQTSQ